MNPTPNDDTVLPIPNLRLPEAVYVLLEPKASSLHGKAKEVLLKGIEADGQSRSSLPGYPSLSRLPHAEMAPYLAFLTSDPSSSLVISPDPDLLARLQAKNTEKLAELDAKLDDAEKNLGETEMSDALRAKATYLARIGEKVS